MTTSDPSAPGQPIFTAAYDQLSRVAAALMREERPGQTLQAMALVREAYVRLAGVEPAFLRCCDRLRDRSSRASVANR